MAATATPTASMAPLRRISARGITITTICAMRLHKSTAPSPALSPTWEPPWIWTTARAAQACTTTRQPMCSEPISSSTRKPNTFSVTAQTTSTTVCSRHHATRIGTAPSSPIWTKTSPSTTRGGQNPGPTDTPLSATVTNCMPAETAISISISDGKANQTVISTPPTSFPAAIISTWRRSWWLTHGRTQSATPTAQYRIRRKVPVNCITPVLLRTEAAPLPTADAAWTTHGDSAV